MPKSANASKMSNNKYNLRNYPKKNVMNSEEMVTKIRIILRSPNEVILHKIL